jgi:ABC-type protease/lipase transport system fused ATPase/permease subunit
MQPTESLTAIVALISVFGSAAYFAYVVLEAIRSRQRTRLTSEFQQKLLDRISSAQELGAFLSSEGGARILATLSPARAAGAPHTRILRALQAGLVLFALGVALFVYIAIRPLPIEGADAIAMIATISTALGVGLLAAAAASYRLSQRLGLLNGRSGETSAVDVA